MNYLMAGQPARCIKRGAWRHFYTDAPLPVDGPVYGGIYFPDWVGAEYLTLPGFADVRFDVTQFVPIEPRKTDISALVKIAADAEKTLETIP